MAHLSRGARGTWRSSHRTNHSSRRVGLEVVHELPEKELSELQQPFSQTQFHESFHPDSEVVWGEWRSEAWAWPRAWEVGDDCVGAGRPQDAQGVGGLVGLGPDLLMLLTLMLVGYRNDNPGSVEQLQLMVDLSHQGQIILKQLEKRCIKHAVQQNSRTSRVQSSSPLLAQVGGNATSHENIASASGSGASLAGFARGPRVRRDQATTQRDRALPS